MINGISPFLSCCHPFGLDPKFLRIESHICMYVSNVLALYQTELSTILIFRWTSSVLNPEPAQALMIQINQLSKRLFIILGTSVFYAVF